MGQCVSSKASAVFAKSSNKSYKIMDKPLKIQNDSKGTSKRGAPSTRGTSISFGFRRRSRGDANQLTLTTNNNDILPPRSKSVGPEQIRRRIIDEDERHQRVQSASSGRSTPKLSRPKKELTSGNTPVRTNRFGFRQSTSRFTDKVTDINTNQNTNNNNFNKDEIIDERLSRPMTRINQINTKTNNNHSAYNNNSSQGMTIVDGAIRRSSGIPEPVSKYTLQSSNLPQPQYAVRINDTNSKINKTAFNQSRKVSTISKSSNGSQSGSGTEDSGIGSQQGYSFIDNEINRNNIVRLDSSPRRSTSRPRNLKMIVNGKNFDVRDCDLHDGDSTVTEISVIPLPKTMSSSSNVNLNTGLIRERTNQYQRNVNKDNRYAESITSMTSMSTMSTTSSEGYDEGLGEEKVYKDRSRSEKKLTTIKNDFSPSSSADDQEEYGHGEAMADEYSFSSIDECRINNNLKKFNIIKNKNKNNNINNDDESCVLLTIEDPEFAIAAAAAAISTTMIDDETSPADSLVDSLTTSLSQTDVKIGIKKEQDIIEKIDNIIVNDDSPGTPTNASNSLSLSEGREYFDDEIADQPGLIFNDTARSHKGQFSQVSQENEQTLNETFSKQHLLQDNSIENSPINCRRVNRMESVGTLSPCESITSDDLMLDYEQSEANSYNGTSRRLDSNPAIHALDDSTILSELEAQSEQVMREWSSLLGTQQPNTNLTNNNFNSVNNVPANESGINSARTSRLLRNRSSTDSPQSLDNVRTKQVPSPFRQVLNGNRQSPSLDSGDEGSPRLERVNYHQDIVSIKTGLLKLMRVVQEAETLNPFSNSSVNGFFQNLNDDDTTDANIHLSNGNVNIADKMTDLRRQVIFLQGQLDDKDRTIHQLQMQVAKQQELFNSTDSQSCELNSTKISKETCNAATQTEKIRPVSAGPSLLQSIPSDSSMGPLVSHVGWKPSIVLDPWNRSTLMYQRPTSLAELNNKSSRKIHVPVASPKLRQENGTIKINGDTDKTFEIRRFNKTQDTKKAKNDTTDELKDGKIDDTQKCTQKITTLKKINSQTFIPRVTRSSDVSPAVVGQVTPNTR
ncbi:M-phase inducer phosphatase isoform X3 [Aphidius gifuensis]|uniref:M-phase inducer phosphatase isoform X3 n=1 Tax=Aphidius gifuensis TaxID=684658 RepID=UPI001CDD6FD0|nr:M-phase inducer phosphatase isoform X3 [Aphidius gifuensis]XP_044011493.1 M-phase inducer phosphatase isoform X3 [Aphidius gifuensis]